MFLACPSCWRSRTFERHLQLPASSKSQCSRLLRLPATFCHALWLAYLTSVLQFSCIVDVRQSVPREHRRARIVNEFAASRVVLCSRERYMTHAGTRVLVCIRTAEWRSLPMTWAIASPRRTWLSPTRTASSAKQPETKQQQTPIEPYTTSSVLSDDSALPHSALLRRNWQVKLAYPRHGDVRLREIGTSGFQLLARARLTRFRCIMRYLGTCTAQIQDGLRDLGRPVLHGLGKA